MSTTLMIIITVVILAGLGYYFLKNKKGNPVVVPPVEPSDNAPTAWDNLIIVPGAEDYELTRDALIYSDSDGDDVTHVRFYGEIENLYYDKEYTSKYMYKEVLPIDFKLYLKFGTKNEYRIKYNVQSNNFWSQ